MFLTSKASLCQLVLRGQCMAVQFIKIFTTATISNYRRLHFFPPPSGGRCFRHLSKHSILMLCQIRDLQTMCFQDGSHSFFSLKYKHQDNTREKKKRFVPYLKISVSKKEMAIGLWFLSLSAQWGLWAPEFLLWMDPQTTIDLSPCLHFHPLVHLWVAAFSLEKRLKEQKK